MIERAFVYGDLLFESMLVLNGSIQHATNHFHRVQKSAHILKMELDDHFTLDFFTQEISRFIDDSSINDKKNCRIRFILYRQGAGFYLPNTNKSNYNIEVFDLADNWLELTQQTKVVGIYKDQRKAKGALANLKTGNALIYVMAKLWAKENNYDDAIILNDAGNIIETASSNLFWKKNGVIFTIPLSEGCIAGVAREVFMQNMLQKNMFVQEEICTLNVLQNADEIFASNALSGMSPIKIGI